MAKKINISQFRSQMNKIQREVKKVERQFKQEINNYNRAVRNYNSNVRSNQNKIQREFNRMEYTYIINTNYYVLTKLVHDVYTEINNSYDDGYIDEEIFNAIENEDANNLELSNVVLNNNEVENLDIELDESKISKKLVKISTDLDNRWKGALFSLNPNNPEATRHFCTSTREILKVLIDDNIKDKDVIDNNLQCKKTNYGTHGHSNRYSLNQLKSFKKRFEDSISFICEYVI